MYVNHPETQCVASSLDRSVCYLVDLLLLACPGNDCKYSFPNRGFHVSVKSTPLPTCTSKAHGGVWCLSSPLLPSFSHMFPLRKALMWGSAGKRFPWVNEICTIAKRLPGQGGVSYSTSSSSPHPTPEQSILASPPAGICTCQAIGHPSPPNQIRERSWCPGSYEASN